MYLPHQLGILVSSMSERFRLSVGVVLRPQYEQSVASNAALTATQRFLHVCDGNDSIEHLSKSLNDSFNRALGKTVIGNKNMLVTSDSYVINSAYSVRDVFDVKDKLYWVVDQVQPVGSVSSTNGKHQSRTHAGASSETRNLASSGESPVLSEPARPLEVPDSTPAMDSVPLATFARDRALENKAGKQPKNAERPAALKKTQKDSSIPNNVDSPKASAKNNVLDLKSLDKRITGHQDFSALDEISSFGSVQEAEIPIRDFVINFWKRDGLVASKSVLNREIQELKEKWGVIKSSSTNRNEMITRLIDSFPDILARDKKKRAIKAAKFKEAKEAREAKAKELKNNEIKAKEVKAKAIEGSSETQDIEETRAQSGSPLSEPEKNTQGIVANHSEEPSSEAVASESQVDEISSNELQVNEPNVVTKVNVSIAPPKTPSGLKPIAQSTPAVNQNNNNNNQSDSEQSDTVVTGKKRPLRRKINRVVALEAETPIERNVDNTIRFGTAPDSESEDSDGGPIRKRRAVAPPRSATPDESTLRAPPTPTPAKKPVNTPTKKPNDSLKPTPKSVIKPQETPVSKPSKPRHSIGLRSLSALENIDTDVHEGRSMTTSNPNVTPKIPDPPETSDEESLSESSDDSSSDSSDSDSGNESIPQKKIAGKREKEKRNRSGFSGLLSDSSKLR